MSKKQARSRFSEEFKFIAVVDALKERHSLADLSRKYEVSQVMIWRFQGSRPFYGEKDCLRYIQKINVGH
jgi:transposase-like protein